MISKRLIFWLSVSLLFFIFLYLIRGVLLPFVLGIFIAYLLDPPTDRMEKLGLSRTPATLAILAMFFIMVMLLSLLIVPIIAGQLSGLVVSLPEYIAAFNSEYIPRLERLAGMLPYAQMESVKSALADVSGVMARMVGEFISEMLRSGVAFINILSLMLITPIVAFYLLRDWDVMVARLDRLLPRPHLSVIREQLHIIDMTLAGFLRGQLNVCLLLGTFYAIGLSLVGLKFAIVIGLGTGLLVIFPYVGLLLGMSIGLGVAFFQFDSYEPVLAVLAVFVIGQIIEGSFVTPKLVGDKVGLHPVWIIFGMLAGGALFGFVGVLIAVPVTAVIGVLIRFALARYLESGYYRGEADAARLKKK
jgi:predicted PurR-regulated permease PerM